MKILHIAQNSLKYEEVILHANRVNRNNHLAVIEKDGRLSYTGGFLINDTPEIRSILDNIPNELQYEFVKNFKIDPFASLYYDVEMTRNEELVLKPIPKKTILEKLFGLV